MVALGWLRADAKRELQNRLAKNGVLAQASPPADAPLDWTTGTTHSLLYWSRKRLMALREGRDKAALWQEIAQQVALAEHLLAHKERGARLWGVLLGRELAVKSAIVGGQGEVGALMFHALVLPHFNELDAAPADPLVPSQLGVIQDACNVFRVGRDDVAFFGGVLTLTQVADAVGDLERADWGRIKGAELLAERGRFADAIRVLEAVSSPNLLDARKRLPILKQQLAASAAK